MGMQAIPAGSPGRGHFELFEVARGFSLLSGNPTPFSVPFPMGLPWYGMFLHIHESLTMSGGSGAVSEGELLAIKNIALRTDRGENVVNNPGRALFRIGQAKMGTLPPKDAVAATTAIYSVLIPIFFADPLMDFPEDTLFNSANYQSVALQVTMGSISDLLGTVSGDTVDFTMDVYLLQGAARLTKQPLARIEYGNLNAVDPSAVQYIDMERAANLAYKRLYAFSSNSATAGTPWSGAGADTTVTDWTVDTDKGNKPFDHVLTGLINALNKQDYKAETAVTGLHIFDFVRDKSIQSAFRSGDKSRLRMLWTNGTLSTSQVSLAYEGIRPLM